MRRKVIPTPRVEFVEFPEFQLNETERETLELLVTGKTNKQIARELGITIHGVKWRMTELFKKLRVKNRLMATVKYNNYLITNPPPKKEITAEIVPFKPMLPDTNEYLPSGMKPKRSK